LKNLTILTSSDEFVTAALKEAQRADPKVHLESALSPEVSLISSLLNFENLAGTLLLQEPVFIRHLCPAYLSLPLDNTAADLPKLSEAIAALPQVAELLAEGTPFSVQVRFVDEKQDRAYTPFAIKDDISRRLNDDTGAVENIKEPEIVVSVVVSGEAYAGISRVEENLSDWAGGMRRFAREPEQISRAEFKLLEALEVFGVALPAEGEVLDLGAAPGGWSKVVLRAGLSVVAVDPADLDPRLQQYPALQHYHGYADEFLRICQKENRQFELILNDMRMDAQLAAEVMCRAAVTLLPDGFALATLKLPHASPKLDPVAITRRALDTLRKSYRTVRARQLFHNRQEVTVLLRK
jgi:23S rRNA (cytidine2498-2'-O)-methyltransferase